MRYARPKSSVKSSAVGALAYSGRVSTLVPEPSSTARRRRHCRCRVSGRVRNGSVGWALAVEGAAGFRDKRAAVGLRERCSSIDGQACSRPTVAGGASVERSRVVMLEKGAEAMDRGPGRR